jgi:hypothetical protein
VGYSELVTCMFQSSAEQTCSSENNWNTSFVISCCKNQLQADKKKDKLCFPGHWEQAGSTNSAHGCFSFGICIQLRRARTDKNCLITSELKGKVKLVASGIYSGE